MTKEANEIISNPTRATLLGRFYERILRKWFEVELGFKVHSGKPRIYWKDQPSPNIRYQTDRITKLLKIVEDIKLSKSHCTPDGLLEKDGKFYIWEAKNWPKWHEPIENVLWNSPWLFARSADYRGRKIDLDGIVFSWWSRPASESLLLAKIKLCVAPLSFDIYYTREILNQCIARRFVWYRSIIEEQRCDIDRFFAELLGEDE